MKIFLNAFNSLNLKYKIFAILALLTKYGFSIAVFILGYYIGSRILNDIERAIIIIALGLYYLNNWLTMEVKYYINLRQFEEKLNNGD